MVTVFRKSVRHLIQLVGLLCLGSGAWFAYAQEPAPVAETNAQPVVEEIPTSDTTLRSQRALETLDRLNAEIGELGGLEKQSERLEQLRDQVKNLLPEGQRAEDLIENQALLEGVLSRSRVLSGQASEIIDGLTTEAEALESKLAELRQLRTQWETARTETPDLPQALVERINTILSRLTALERIGHDKLNDVVELQNSTMTVSNTITPIADRIRSYSQDHHVLLLEANTRPIWQLTRENISSSSTRSGQEFIGSLGRDFRNFVGESGSAIGGHLLLLPLLLVLMVRLKQTAREAPSAALARPLATGILVWMLIGVAVWGEAAQTVRSLYVMVAMLTAGVVLYAFLPKNLRTGALIILVVAVAERLISVLPASDPLSRVAYMAFGATMTVLAYYGHRPQAIVSVAEWGVPRPFFVVVTWLTAGLSAAGVLANVFGFVHLSKLLIGSSVDSIATFLVLFAGLTTISEIVTVMLGLRALDNFHSIARNRMRLKRVLHRPLVWIALLLWLWVTASLFGVDEWVIDSLAAILYAEASIGEVTLSLRGVAVFILAIWVAVWSSRIVRAVLNQDVLPRMDLPRGVPNTISMTAHYTIMMLGLLLAVGFIGLDLSSLALVIGALGVGIGFGLQNLVNNFVSGLILIFEAPIQVGDTVEVGELMGKVVQIGIRTSRVRTYSGSEVIVPNGDLVSNQVINWTLSDRRRRLNLAVGVAYGSDPAVVTALLRETVEADEDVLEDPPPIIVFNDFGDSALNFQVLAWIADFDRGFEMRHRLNSAINNALKTAGVTIPFPQRDLHVKSLPSGGALQDIETSPG